MAVKKREGENKSRRRRELRLIERANVTLQHTCGQTWGCLTCTEGPSVWWGDDGGGCASPVVPVSSGYESHKDGRREGQRGLVPPPWAALAPRHQGSS